MNIHQDTYYTCTEYEGFTARCITKHSNISKSDWRVFSPYGHQLKLVKSGSSQYGIKIKNKALGLNATVTLARFLCLCWHPRVPGYYAYCISRDTPKLFNHMTCNWYPMGKQNERLNLGDRAKIVDMYYAGVSQVELAEKFGVCRQHIHEIIRQYYKRLHGNR